MIPVSKISVSGWKVNDQLSILVGGFLYYVAVLILAVSHVESKFIMDGFSHVFTIANWETFSPTMGRHILILLQAFPVFCAKLGATTMEIMFAYVVWDVFFFVVVFLTLLCVLKDPLAALLSVSVHAFGMIYNHFMMVGELSPGSMFAIMTISLIRNWQSLPKTKQLLIIPAAFFTVSSHPLALVSFLVFIWIWRFSLPNKVGMGRVKLISVSLLTLLLKWFLLDNYDKNTIDQAQRSLSEAVIQVFDWDFLLNFSLHFISSSPVVAMLTVFCIVYLIGESKYKIASLFLFFQLSWVVVVQQYLDFSSFSLGLSQSMMHDRYLFPMRFVSLATVFLIVVPFGVRKYNWFNVHRYVIASWLIGIPFLFFSAQKADRTIAELRNSVIEARKQSVSKGYYLVEQYCKDIYIHRGSFFATFVLSTIDGAEPCHVIHPSEEIIQDLNGIQIEELLLMNDLLLSNKVLNANRFRIQSGVYEKIDYSCDE